MPGIIIGAMGQQRSGKTLLMYLLAKNISTAEKIPVYTNLQADDEHFNFINSIDEIPLNFDPKIVLIDEIYNGADAQDWKILKDVSILINTLGKQNVLFLFTTIDFSMVYNRIRNQMKYAVMVKTNQRTDTINYRILDCENLGYKDFSIQKSESLFKELRYDTSYVPLDFDWTMDNFRNKLINYYRKQYPNIIKYIQRAKK
ncbi:ATP-binding protein [Anaerotalea alkaliphila]|uniref:ATP-binding protein n=1 Tax=Anaerotalea alkaliphila TaxID=2662126 RepID=A0A7X5HW52_9FIRM|nr:ATP-binding protein [Anaerotalea alkaliphila]NDL67708.1 ATP-binding protein [Anaerotalea alkaliphila]